MVQVLYSARSSRKIVHLPHCKIIQRIPKEHRKTFESVEEARAHGYRLCNCCPSIARKYRKERAALKRYAGETGLHVKLMDDAVHVISTHDCWQIVAMGRENQLFLYHKNTEYRTKKSAHPSKIPGFHSQKHRADTILDYLKYIHAHDAYYNTHFSREKFLLRHIETPCYRADEREDYHSQRPDRCRVKGTKRYKKQQKELKRQKRLAEINRVKALLDEIGYMDH